MTTDPIRGVVSTTNEEVFVKVNTRELEGAALDWAVYRCEEQAWEAYDEALHAERDLPPRPSEFVRDWLFLSDEFRPSTDWAVGGPIIEREGLNVRPCYSGGIRNTGVDSWRADLDFQSGTLTLGKFIMYGKTALVAAMRCFVASRLGETVDIPDELV